MHSLLHVELDVKLHGSLDNYSAFEFENYMQTLKRMLRSNSSHLSQIVRRVGEAELFQSCKVAKQDFIYSSVSSNDGDNCVILTNGIVSVIVQRISQTQLECRHFKTHENVINYPFDSSKIGVFIVSDLDKQTHEISIDRIKKKCILLPISVKKYFCIPMCNT